MAMPTQSNIKNSYSNMARLAVPNATLHNSIECLIGGPHEPTHLPTKYESNVMIVPSRNHGVIISDNLFSAVLRSAFQPQYDAA